MNTISISGHPLPAALVVDGVSPDEYIDETGWILSIVQASDLLQAWKDAPGESDVIRQWEHFENGHFVTALTMEGETSISQWDSAYGSDGTEIYSTANMPFDFDVVLIEQYEAETEGTRA